jgi:hypothetical protein
LILLTVRQPGSKKHEENDDAITHVNILAFIFYLSPIPSKGPEGRAGAAWDVVTEIVQIGYETVTRWNGVNPNLCLRCR